MTSNRWLVPFLNLGHLLDHLVMLVFPTAVVALGREWGRPYSELLPLALGSFVAFGAFAIPAGWLADHWSRYRTMVIFYFGIGASLFVTGFAQSPWQIAAGLTLTGAFAAIYHPVGIAMLVASPEKMGRTLGWNGLWGNLGLAAAALITGALVDLAGWRAAFFVPGLACVAAGIGFLVLVKDPGRVKKVSKGIGLHVDGRTMARIFAVLLIATACGGIIFNSTTVSLADYAAVARAVPGVSRAAARLLGGPFNTLLVDSRENVYVRPGDVLTVVREPQRFTAFGGTGRNELIPFDAAGMTLEQALARAGGLLDFRADSSGVFLLRFEPAPLVAEMMPERKGQFETAYVPVVYRLNLRNVNSYFMARAFQMRDKDILYVSNAPLTEVQKFLSVIGSAVAPVAAGAAVYNLGRY